MPKDQVGTKKPEFVLNVDLAPTILSAAGIAVPDVMQGKNIASLYLNKDTFDSSGAKARTSASKSNSWRTEFLYEFRDDNKYIANSVALVQKGFKFIHWEDHGYEQVFNLDDDPYEESDLRNVTSEAVLRKLRMKLNKYQELAKGYNSK